MVKKVTRATAKKPVRRPAKKKTAKSLAKVPVEFVFWCHDGNTFSDLQELAWGLETMSDDIFAYHSNGEKQDFSNWVRDVIEDELLAYELASAASRMQAANCVTARIAMLRG